MTKEQKFYNLGSGWISGYGYGTRGSNPRFSSENMQFQFPELQEYIAELPSRFGRFDVYTKVTFSAAVLALKDAGMLEREGKKNVGLVIGSSSGVYDNDLAYFESTGEAKGAFTSPNLFSYTLPNVALGEIAVYFGFIGPSFCMGNNLACPGGDALTAALSLLNAKQCESVLVGWVEVAQRRKDQEALAKGAAFALLSLERTRAAKVELTFNQNFKFMSLFKE